MLPSTLQKWFRNGLKYMNSKLLGPLWRTQLATYRHANDMVPNTTAHLQSSCGVHASERSVTTVLSAQRGPIQYQSDGLKAIADQCIS